MKLMASIRSALEAMTMAVLLTGTSTAVEAPKVEFEHYRLPNGLQVILHIDRKLPIVHVNQWFHVGSKNEKPGRTGFAHLFEHMMFQGSKNADGEYFDHVEEIGANLMAGGVNGTTDPDRTNYFVTTPSGTLEYLLWLESDRLSGLLDVLTQEKLDNQREVVKNERRQSLENVPYGRAFEVIFDNLFPARHPYSWPTIGSMVDLNAASVEDVKEFFRRFYTPNNLTLTLAGDFDPAEARKLVEKYFGTISAGPALERPRRLPSVLDADELVVVADRVPQPRTYMVWPAVHYFHPDEAPLDFAAAILSDGLSSRLQKLLIYEKQICTKVEAYAYALEVAGIFVVEATGRPGQDLEQVETLVADELAKLAKEPPAAREVERARSRHDFQFISGLERIGGFGGKADQLARYNTYLGKPDMFAQDLARYAAVAPEEVQDAVSRYLDGRHRLTVRFLPEESGRPLDVEVDRSRTPGIQSGTEFEVPEVERSTLENGLELLVVRKPELPKVAIQLIAHSGSASEPLEKAGVAQLTLNMLDKGTPKRSAIELAEALADMGTELGRRLSVEYSKLSLEVLTRHTGAALGVLAEVATAPTFPEEELERERKKALDDLLQSQQDPRRIGRRLAPMLLFGREHPFGHDALGSESSLAALTRADLETFHGKTFQAANSALVFAGDISMAEARELALEHFGGWPKGAAQSDEVPPASRAAPKTIYLVDRQDSAQTNLILLLPGITRDSPDHYALEVVDAVYGGGFGSRLNLNLREEKGYSYGAFSSLIPLTQTGYWYAGGGVQTKVTSESLTEFLKELRGLAGEKPLAAEELEKAKANRIRGYAQQFESLDSVASEVATLWILRRPMSELAATPVELGKIGLEQANAAAVEYARPDDVIVIAIGDRDKIEPGLRALGVAEIVRLDPLGNPENP